MIKFISTCFKPKYLANYQLIQTTNKFEVSSDSKYFTCAGKKAFFRFQDVICVSYWVKVN